MVYENVLSGAFIYAMGAVAGKRSNQDEIVKDSINFFQQTPYDSKVGCDLLADWAGKSFLIEFKRSIAQLPDEMDKEGKSSLGKLISKNNEIRKLSERCHFLGYGKHPKIQNGDTARTDFTFQSYLSLLTSQNGKEYDINSFISGLLNSNSDTGITSKKDFNTYLEFLMTHAEKPLKSSSSGGKIRESIKGLVSIISPEGRVIFIEYRSYNHLAQLMSQKIEMNQYLSEQIAFSQRNKIDRSHGLGM